MANLSKNFLIGDAFERVWNRAKQDEMFTMEPDSVLAIGKLTLVNHFSIANGALRKYLTKVEEGVTINGGSAAMNGYIDISTKNYFDVLEVSFGYSQQYHKAPNWTKFLQKGKSSAYESKTNGRWWFWTQGEDKVRLFQGSAIVSANTENTFHILHVRYPDLTMFTIAAVEANTAYMDLPDFMIPFFVIAWTVEVFKEGGLNAAALQGDVNSVLERMGDKLVKEEREMLALNVTNPTN